MFLFIYSTNIYKGPLKVLDKCNEQNKEKHYFRAYFLKKVTKLISQVIYKNDLQ